LFLIDLKFALLEYRYSTTARWQEWSDKLFGISLELPTMTLDSTTAFSAPSRPDEASAPDDETSTGGAGGETPFLWQAPNSNAILFLGEKWAELHGFVSKTLAVQSKLKQTPRLLSEKMVSKKYPAWLEHALRLARARGYWTLYPPPSVASVVAAVHHDLDDTPEEYRGDAALGKKGRDSAVQLGSYSFLDSLPKRGSFPPFQNLPLLSWDGKKQAPQDFDREAAEYALNFRRSVGGCGHESLHDTVLDAAAQDLFCLKVE